MLIMVALAEVFRSCQERFRPAMERFAGQLLDNLGIAQADDKVAADKLAAALKDIHLPDAVLETAVDRIYLSDTQLAVKAKFEALPDFTINKFILGKDKDALAYEVEVKSEGGKLFYIQVDRINGLIAMTNKSLADGHVRTSSKRMPPAQQAAFIALILREGDEPKAEAPSCPISQLNPATVERLTGLGLNLTLA